LKAQAAAVTDTQDALTRIATPSGEADPQSLDLSHPFINPVYQTLAFQIATSRTRLAAMERQEREMVVVRKLGGTRFDELTDLYRRTAELSRLETNLDLAKQVYQTLTVRYEQSRAESVDSMVQLQIVDAAITPELPLSRKRAQTAALGATIGFIVAALTALAWGTRDRPA
jgi:capsule polysaccharide export protein KpsE/RkpR